MSNENRETTPSEIVNTVEGPIRGYVEDKIATFRGIPYAAPPVGPLRWRAPAAVPNTPWTAERDATKNGPSSWQNEAVCEMVGGGHPGEMSEDCLYLNVWSPRPEAGANLPVMVWIHGGAYILGSGGLNIYDGRPLAAKGAVVVSINYRLGCLGFFKHPVLEAETAAGVKINNFGLLDQIAALEWVNRNIEKFGGNPGNVTIFGQSAGARSVLALYVSPLITGRAAKGLPQLFHKGIAQSVYRMKEVLGPKAEKRCVKLIGLVAPTREALTPERLRALPVAKLINADGELSADDLEGTSNSPVAIVGDSVLSEVVFQSFTDGNALHLPLIIGNTSDDVSVVLDTKLTEQSMIDLSGKWAVTLVKYYPDLEQNPLKLDRVEIGRRVGRDGFFTEVTNRIGHVHTEKGGSAWQYYFDYTADGLRHDVKKGTRHGDDVVFTLDTGNYADLYAPPPTSPPTASKRVTFTPADHAFAHKVSEYWFQFALTGTPSCAGSPAWPATTAEHSNTLLLGNAKAADKAEITLSPDFMKAHMDDFGAIGVSYDFAVSVLP